MTIQQIQPMSDYCTPFIVDDSFDPSAFVGEHFLEQIQSGALVKSGHYPSMSFDKISRRDMLEPYPSGPYHDTASYAYGEGSYGAQQFYDHNLPCGTPDSDYYYPQDENVKIGQHVGHKALPASAAPTRRQSSLNGSEVNVLQHLETQNTMSNPRKRRASDTVEYDVLPPQKRVTSVQLQMQNPSIAYYDGSGQTSPYSPFIATPASTASLQPAQATFPSGRPMGHHYSTSNASQVSLAAPSPHTPVWSPSFATVKTEPSPPAPMTPVPRPASASPLKSSVPRLVRTSTINHHSSSPVHGTMGSMHPANFNPYAMYPLKANLKLKGDLDSMTKDWNSEEIDARRRLVEFKRSQDGSTISADFKPVAPQDRAPSSITISCILWKEKQEYYVTSVDTIYLLEALVGVRFTVEEKNRIRRNLEGFRPATVSKSKSDSEEFFKVIMGFPHPKPRNIEKDVKVFPWKILAHALKKIISKYSASYSSTASALLTPVPSTYASTEHSAEFTYPPSPPTEYAHPTPPLVMSNVMAYAHNQIPGRMSAPVTTAPLPELQLQVPTMGPTYDAGEAYSFAAMPGMPQASMILTPEAMSAPCRMQPSWESFVNDSPVTTAPQSAPALAYHRGPVETADFGPPTSYQMH